jgi:glutamate-1-semialdehyde 2,1-aminomutase
MTAGWAMLRELTPAAFTHLNSLGDQLRTQLNDLFRRKQIRARAVGQGSLFSIHFTDEEVRCYRALARTDKGLAQKVFLALIQEGYFLSQGLAMCSLSLPMDKSHVEGLVAAVDRAIERATGE